MFFRLSNGLASFQKYINKFLAGNLNIFPVVYLDDILFYTQDRGQLYSEAIYCVCNQLRKYNHVDNLKKYRFY